MTSAPDTYEGLHAGDLVLGDDGEVWGVSQIWLVPHLVVTLVRPGHAVTGTPPAGTPVTVVKRADFWPEYQAGFVLSQFGPIEVLGEVWTE